MALTHSQEIQRRIFVDMIRALPELTLAGFSRLLTDRFADIAAVVTVGDLVGVEPAQSRASTSVLAASGGGDLSVKRGPGRPKGSKTLHRTAAVSAATPEVKRGPGRPPGKATAKPGPAAAAMPAVSKPVAAKTASSKSVTAKPGTVDTRTRSGRDRYEASIRAYIVGAGRPVSAPEIRAAVGGDDVQARRALNRLIGRGELGYQGKARGTRYVAP